MRVLGIMSGTSLDAVDYVICSFGQSGKIRFEEHWQVRFPPALQRRLFAAASDRLNAYDIAQVHHDLGRFYAAGARNARKVNLVGLHGQTIFHKPQRPAPATFQIGEPAYLAEELRVPVVANFRGADLAAGGEGAPLATVFHREVFAAKGRHVAVNNLGGISNVTSMDWRKRAEPRMLAFDTGPGNMLMDLAVSHASEGKKQFDRNGKVASRGTVDARLLARWLKNPFFRKSPPKSTGRELFGERFLAEVLRAKRNTPDLLATLTEFTACSIALNYRMHLESMPDEVILCGGGAANRFLVSRIAAALRETKPDLAVRSVEHYGWKPQVIEAAAFALLAWRTWHRLPGNDPQTTGAKGPRIVGQVTAPFSGRLQIR